jgi:protein O-mannosyl-transferase
VIVAAGVTVYRNSVHLPFFWDDLQSIVNNPTIRRLWPLPGPLAPPLETPMAGRPVVNLSLAVNYASGGLNVEGYHWLNVGVHVLCAILLFAIVRRTFSGRRLAPLFERGANATALTVALIWMLHPLQTEAVVYVTQRTESMMALFFLVTLYAAIRARRAPRPEWWEAAAVIACGLGMASKASMVGAPIAVLLYDRAFEFATFGEAIRKRWRLYSGLAATWVALALLMWSAPRSTVGASDAVGWLMYLLNQAQVVGRYLRLAVWPRGLVLDYGLPEPIALRDVWPQGIVLVALAIATAVAWRRRPAAGFAGAVFFMMLAPTSSVIPITSEVGAERRMYIPMMALAVLAVAVGWLLLDRMRRRIPTASPALNLAAAVIVAGVVLALGAATIARNKMYEDPVGLWRDAVDQWPNGRARLSLAVALIDAKRPAEAVNELRLAVPQYGEAKYALGAALASMGQIDEAVGPLTDFITARPSHPSRIPARFLLGQILASQQRADESAEQFRAILVLAPSNRGARTSLGDLLLSQQRYVEAAAEYERALEGVAGGVAEIEIKLGMARMGAGQPDAAAPAFERALALDARAAAAHQGLAEIAWQRGRRDEAVAHAEAALRVNPEDAVSHNLIGVVLASSGRIKEAAVHFREAVRIQPADERMRENLERAERLLAR